MILCCGDALIDMLPVTDATGTPAFAPATGGAVFNTAIALGRMGTDVWFCSGISTDIFGTALCAGLKAAGVEFRHVIFSDRPTTLAFVTLRDGQARYTFYDENTAGRMITTQDMPLLGPETRALFFGGISLAAEPAAGTYATFLTHNAASRVVMLDPNIRPSFIRDTASYRTRLSAMIARSDIVKLSDEDLHWLQGPGTLADLARTMLSMGPKLVLITEGAKGAHGYFGAHHVFEPAQKVVVVDTVGAGDTFNAGVLTALARTERLEKSAIAALDAPMVAQMLRLGNAAAAITVSRVGANPPFAHEITL